MQIKWDALACTVKAKISPEHKVNQKLYRVTVVVESENTIKSAECHDCVASLGGCKHAIAVIGWLHRRTEDKASTSQACYWQKPTLSKISTHNETFKVAEIHRKAERDQESTMNEYELMEFVEDVILEGRNNNFNGVISNILKVDKHVTSMHNCVSLYSGDAKCVNTFLRFCKTKMTENNITHTETKRLPNLA